MHIPNDNGQCSNNGNGHNPFFYRIDNELIPSLLQITRHVSGKNYDYSLELAASAAKHAEYMMRMRRLCHTPKYMMVGEAENVGRILAKSMEKDDLDEVFWHLVARFKEDYEHGRNLDLYGIIGNAMAFDFDNNGAPTIYVVQRFAKRVA